MAGDWIQVTVAEVLEPISLAGTAKIPSTAYKPTGRYPIVDQGREPIAGWTDDDDAVIAEPLPMVVFGDHTRALKFVDFPFARGADGTQLLRPIAGVDPLFFYYACRAIPLASRGYNRHLSALKESVIELPSDEDEQRQIAVILRFLEQGIQRQMQLSSTMRELKRAAMNQLFTHGIDRDRETREDSALATIPAHWVVEPLAAHHKVASGTTPSRSNSAYWTDAAVPWVKTAEVDYCVITETEEHISAVAITNGAARVFSSGTLLLAMYGQGVTRGKVAILGIDAACNQACAAINPTDDAIATRYLYHFLASRYDAIRELAHGGQQQNLNLDIVRDIPIAYPPDKQEQARVVAVLDASDVKRTLHDRVQDVLQCLFDQLLQALMTRQVRVDDFDLSAALDAADGVLGAAS
jgi:type I restriction enzyme S subunit